MTVENGQKLTPILWHSEWAALKQPWKVAKLWWLKFKQAAISLLDLLKITKKK